MLRKDGNALPLPPGRQNGIRKQPGAMPELRELNSRRSDPETRIRFEFIIFTLLTKAALVLRKNTPAASIYRSYGGRRFMPAF